MNNTNFIFIALHRKYQNITPIEYYIDINKIIAITPHNPNIKDGGTTITTVSSEVFYCEESIYEVIKLMEDAFNKRITTKEHILKRS